MKTVLTGAKLVGVDDSQDEPSTIVVDDAIVSAVVAGVPPAGAADVRVDLDGRWVMPGMTCGHGHAQYRDIALVGGGRRETRSGVLTAIAVANFRAMILSGFTGYVGAGSSDLIDTHLHEAIETGIIDGPHMLVGSERGAFGKGAARAAEIVDDLVARGADIIKVFATGGHGGPLVDEPRVGRDELAAIVAAAHGHGKRVRAHCVYRRSIIDAIETGVDLIDHGDELDAEGIQMMADRGTYWVPSAHFLSVLSGVTEAEAPRHEIDAARRYLGRMHELLETADACGVRILLGDDYGMRLIPHGLGAYAREMETYVSLGCAPEAVTRWATANGADILGLPHAEGRLAIGCTADIVVTNENPLRDIGLLSRPTETMPFVMKAGTILKNELPGSLLAHAVTGAQKSG